MKRFLCSLYIYVLVQTICSAQGEANNWYFGFNAGVTFNSGAPVALTGGQLQTYEGCTSISDEDGNLLFYTDGIQVWNSNHQQMPNGFGLVGNPSSAQSGVVVPKPGASNIYILFSVASEGNADGFCYSEVDMNLEGGYGDIIVATKNTPLFSPATEKVTAVRHANGMYVWVIAKRFNTNQYYSYLIDCQGVGSPVISNAGEIEGWPGWGCLVASPDGTKLASAARSVGFELLDFDNATGIISNAILLSSPGEVYGVCFSPNGNLLYGLRIIGGSIYQWNLQAGTTANIISSMMNIGTASGTGSPYRGGAIQQGPDGKLYITQYGQPYLTAINNPNTIGPGCNVQSNAVSLAGNNSYLGLPPFIIDFLETFPLVIHTGDCEGIPIQFAITGNTSYLDSVEWNFDDSASGSQNESSQLNPAHTFNNAGNYNVRLIRHLNCISDTTFHQVTVLPATGETVNVTICANESYTLPGGDVVNTTGTYIDIINICGNAITTNLTVLPVSQITQNIEICGNSVYVLPNGETTNVGGTYAHILQASNSCDSIVTTVLNFVSEFNGTINAVICPGQTYTLPSGEIVSNAGIYADTMQALSGCDSTITTVLSIAPIYDITQNITICANENFIRPNGQTVNTSGTYIDFLYSIHGCDSVVTTILTVNPTYSSTQYVTICDGEIYIRPNGQAINSSGTYVDVLSANNGCDSIITTIAVVSSPPSVSFSWTPNPVDFSNPEVSFINHTQGGSAWEWRFGDLDGSFEENPDFHFPNGQYGEYEICLAAHSDEGCFAEKCGSLVILPHLIFYCPNAFTPDNNQLNERFIPVIDGHATDGYLFQIFDRWGQMIFETSDPNEGWVGSINGGEYFVQNDVYIWRVEAKELFTTEKKLFTGSVTVVR